MKKIMFCLMFFFFLFYIYAEKHEALFANYVTFYLSFLLGYCLISNANGPNACPGS